MTETYTGGTIKVSCPSNYAENRRGSEVSLSFALPEGTTCDQADEATRRVRLLCLKHVIAGVSDALPSKSDGGSSSSASDTGSSLKAPAPEKTAASTRSARKPPSDITIGSTQTGAGGAETASIPATIVAPAIGATGIPPGNTAPVTAAISDASVNGTSEGSLPALSSPPPFAAATPASPEPAQPATAVNGSAPAFSLPASIPPSTGTAGSAPPFAPGPAVVASPAGAPASEPVGGIGDLDLRRAVAAQIVRINQLAPGQGGNVVNSMVGNFVTPPAGLLSIPQEDRERFLATLAAWQGGVA